MNKVILISEHQPDFIVQGFGLRQSDNQAFVGKMGSQEIMLFPVESDGYKSVIFQPEQGDNKVIFIGAAEANQNYRQGDVLMVGSDDMLDRAFQVMDEMGQRGVVVDLSPSQNRVHLYLAKEQVEPIVQECRNRKISFLCLWMVALLDTDMKANLLANLRKILLK